MFESTIIITIAIIVALFIFRKPILNVLNKSTETASEVLDLASESVATSRQMARAKLDVAYNLVLEDSRKDLATANITAKSYVSPQEAKSLDTRDLMFRSE